MNLTEKYLRQRLIEKEPAKPLIMESRFDPVSKQENASKGDFQVPEQCWHCPNDYMCKDCKYGLRIPLVIGVQYGGKA